MFVNFNYYNQQLSTHPDIKNGIQISNHHLPKETSTFQLS